MSIQQKSLQKQKFNFSCGALSHMKTRGCLKYFANDSWLGNVDEAKQSLITIANGEDRIVDANLISYVLILSLPASFCVREISE